MYNYVPELPYFGIVSVANDGDPHFWAKWYGGETPAWDETVSKVGHNDRHLTLIGVLPDWAETDEFYGTQLPLTRRVASG